MKKVTVSADALRQVLQALNGPGYRIAELQALRHGHFGAENPINKLIDEYNAAAKAGLEQMTAAAQDVLAERRRQIEAEGWTPASDDTNTEGQMADAAASYALNAGVPMRNLRPTYWPWPTKWWKPTTPRRDLVKAGALILAEIERLDRAEVAKAQPQPSGD